MTLRWIVFLLGGLFGVAFGGPITLSFLTTRGLTVGTHLLFVIAAPFTMAIAALWLGLNRRRAAPTAFATYGLIAGTCGGLVAIAVITHVLSE